MATIVTPVRKNIFYEGARFLSAVSEELIQRIAASINFINERQYEVRDFIANGQYNAVGSFPIIANDGLSFFLFDVEIIDVWAWVQFAGSGGTTELDLKYTTAPGGSFTSLFSTTPKLTAGAGNYAYIHLGAVLAGATAPVLATSSINAGWAFRLDILQAQSGTVNGAGLQVHYRPR